jgi:3-phytase
MRVDPRPILVLFVTAGCGPGGPHGSDATLVREAFVTDVERGSNMDSPAVWTGPGDETWILTTGKSTHRLYVHDATSGELLRTVGGHGSRLGEFRRPNGIAVMGDLALVVERDNARVQVLRLPELRPVGHFGAGTLRKPYGIALLARDASDVEVFVTDDYRAFAGRTPRDAELGQRVRRFLLRTSGDRVASRYLGAFGDTAGAGRLLKVESIAVDPEARTLLVADEESRDVKVYRVDGSFTGRTLWRNELRHEPEGIALYTCGARDGYWIVVDQHRRANRFLVFDRATFRPLGAFRGGIVQYTDGIALLQRPIGSMTAGALYGVHADRAVAAFSWSDVASALRLRADCAG